MTPAPHVSVLLDAVCAGLALRDGGLWVDATLGAGGHAEAILERTGPTGRLVGLDRDPTALEIARERLARFGDRVELHETPFSGIAEALAGRRADGVLADLGVSSMQFDRAERGMSFRFDAPLDMRMGPDAERTAEELLREVEESDLADMIYEYGEERRSRRIARSIKRAVEAGEMQTTKQLAEAVYRAVGGPRRGDIDPATRTFQALRIVVNDELGELDRLLAALPDALADGGRAAVISFHSLEDRKVKWAFRGAEALSVVTKRPIEADEAERAANPRSRSAKLRVAERVPREEAGA
ncbi:MAG: 16S rRNA (cytosine(1402)-N(4))-methyltransferase RsmH [Polyangiales bacterium]